MNIYSNGELENNEKIQEYNIEVPVIRFESSKNVILIPRNMTGRETIKEPS